MSKLKAPREKKLASLAHDRRNVYGENDKSSRKSIPRGKRTSQHVVRSSAKRHLTAVEAFRDEDVADQAESKLRSAVIKAKRNAFRKIPDAPLGEVLKKKSEPYVPAWFDGDKPKKRRMDRPKF